MYELHFAIPIAGGILCTLNARLDSTMVSVLPRHSEAKIIFVDYQLLEIARGALDLLSKTNTKPPILILISNESDDSISPSSFASNTTGYEYESFLETGHTGFEIRRPISEWDPISLNYTSGATSRPKGICIVTEEPTSTPSQGGTNICLRSVSPKGIFESIALHNVTHMGGAPTVLNMIVNSALSDRKPLPHRVEVFTGGSPPPPPILFRMEELGFGVTHMYGLTETYGPGTYCTWKPEWDSLPPDERSKIKARQGMQHIGLEEVDIKDPITMQSVLADGKTMGPLEGYHHFGGENISTVEVETVLYNHPAVLEAVVVARPDNHWGQTPCAFVKLKGGFEADAQLLIKFCRDHLPHYKAPKTLIFEELPRT
ncbi:hypothetical protein CRYUN_Cryun07bG0198100 [Craigia yunnanensis]